MKINQMIENIKKYHKGYGTIDEATTRDQILYGDANQECTGVVTTCWASVDVIRFAIEKGANFIICHEALFWNHGDHTDWLEESKNEVYLEKKQLLDDHGIVVWRNHDYIHSGIPFCYFSTRIGISFLILCSREISVSVATTPGISCILLFSKSIRCSLSHA